MMRSLAVALALVPLAASAEIVDAVAVVVNGEIITLSELEDRLGPQLPAPDAEGEALKKRRSLLRRAAEELVAEKLVQKEADEEGLAPTAAELDNAIEDIKRSNRIDDQTLTLALRQQGLTMERYREMLRQQLTRMKLVETKVKGRVSVSEDDVKARYAKVAGDMKGAEELKVRDIFLPAGADPAATKARVEAARKRIESGEAFKKVAEETGGPLAASGGDLGWIRPGMMLPEIEKTVFELKAGALTPVLEAGGGFHLLTVEERRTTGGARPLAEAREEIRQQLVAEKLEKATDDYLGELRRNADIEYRLP